MSPVTLKPNRPLVAVLGGGFGGVACCKALRGNMDVLLIDRQNHHLFQPLLYQVAMSGLAATEIASPIRRMFRGYRNVQCHMGHIESIDLETRRVTAEGYTFEPDYIVIAVGGVTSYFGNDHWADHALGLKSLDDALQMRRQLLTSFELAENEDDEAEQRRLMTIVIVGGGPTGVELAGSMAELVNQVFRRDFRRIDTAKAKVILIEASDRLLDTFSGKLSASAEKQLAGLGVDIRKGVRVTDIDAGKAVLSTGEVIETRNVLWGAGVAANPLSAGLPVEKDRAGRIQVAPDLSLPGHPNVFAIGDIVSMTQDDGSPVPGVAPAAIQMGRHVAGVISREVRASPAPPADRQKFAYVDKGSMATIGRKRAIASIGRFQLSGMIAWLAWLVVHLVTLIDFRNRLAVLIQWTYAYFTFRRGARIIPQRDEERLQRYAHDAEDHRKTGPVD